MPRNLNLGASTLRNRNRVTNKTRLRVVTGNIDADPLVLDDDEEKARVLSTAGVDAEDANEHHLQVVLSAASQRNQAICARTTRGGSTSHSTVPVAYIPTPDSTGIVDNYHELYPLNRWTEPATYIRTSETIDSYILDGLNDQFTYYMDERDKEWLTKNNEEARGEGTSAQGAVSSVTTTRSGSFTRSAKAKGKEPEVVQPIVITEDEFELAMGLFEKVTQDKTPFLNHVVEEGQVFPPFSEYQDSFLQPLPSILFTSYTAPTWVSQNTLLVRIARAIYPWWKERRMERGGHRIIPILNFNEADVANESYICFRHREIKAVRKTRAQQATPSDKVIRLRQDLTSSIEIARQLCEREKLKRDLPNQVRLVWTKRVPILDLKRNFSSLGSKEDEDLLVEKERVPKKAKPEARIKIRRDGVENASPTMHVDPIRPKQRFARIQNQIEREVQKQKEKDHHWEDQIDSAYQQFPIPYYHRLFKYIQPNSPSWSSPSRTLHATADRNPIRSPRALRLRYGRGGRLFIDRRSAAYKRPERLVSESTIPSSDQPEGSDSDPEREWRTADRWKHDLDDNPAFGPEGPEEQDRILTDDFHTKYLRHAITLLNEHDPSTLLTDPTIVVQAPDGHTQTNIIPFRLGVVRKDTAPRPYPPGYPSMPPFTSQQATAAIPSAATPISIPTSLKKMPPPLAPPPLRISSSGGQRRPNHNPVALLPPPQPNNISTPMISGVNGILERSKAESDVQIPNQSSPLPNGNIPVQPKILNQDSNNASAHAVAPSRPKSQNQQPVIPLSNGYHFPQMNGFQSAVNNPPYLHHTNTTGLNPAQLNQLKSAFAGADLSAALHSNGRFPHYVPNGAAFSMQQVVGANLNLKVPGTRPMPWPVPSPPQRSMAGNTLDATRLNGNMSPSPNLGQVVPVRSPSSSGTRPGMRGGVAGISPVIAPVPNAQLSHSMSPHLHPSPSPLPQGMAQLTPNPSPHHTPSLLSSPSIQQQVVGTQGGC